eukprot:scaffold591515_cov17-Prasinocladus_malaysianus.AAC.1
MSYELNSTQNIKPSRPYVATILRALFCLASAMLSITAQTTSEHTKKGQKQNHPEAKCWVARASQLRVSKRPY